MKRFIEAKAGGRRYSIPVESIVYMEKDRRKIIIHTVREDISFYGRYEEIKPFLSESFTHPHRSYVVNMDYIFRLGDSEAVMTDGKRITMGTRCFIRLRKSYDSYIAKKLALIEVL